MTNLRELSVPYAPPKSIPMILPLQSLTRLAVPVSLLQQQDASKVSQLSGLSHLTLQMENQDSYDARRQQVPKSLRLLAHLRALKQLELMALQYDIGIFEALTALTQLTGICLELKPSTFGACRLGNAPLYLSLLPKLSCLRLKVWDLIGPGWNAKIMTEIPYQFQQHLPSVQIVADDHY